MSDCLFCKISRGELGTNFVYEDDDCVAFHDINPKERTHLLVVPKSHIESVSMSADEDRDLLGKMMLVCRDVGKKLNLPGYKLQINVDKDGGQEIFHIHVHLLSKFG